MSTRDTVMEQRGEPIAGSQLFRDFCAVCSEPIRVTVEKRGLPQNFCLDCMRKAVQKLAESVQQQAEGRAAPPMDDADEDYDFDTAASVANSRCETPGGRGSRRAES